MVRFFRFLKHAWTNHEDLQNLADAQLRVSRYMETYEDFERLHQMLE